MTWRGATSSRSSGGAPASATSSVGVDLTLAEAFALIARAAGRRAPRVQLPYGAALLLAWLGLVNTHEVTLARHPAWFSFAKAERELGYRASPLEPALARAVADLG